MISDFKLKKLWSSMSPGQRARMGTWTEYRQSMHEVHA